MTANTTNNLIQDLSTAGLKVSPPITVYALTLNEWVAVATILYLILQAGYLIWKWRTERRRARAIDEAMSGPVADFGAKP